MKGAPWFPFYPADFLGGTFAMDAAEVGAYLRLLCLQWQGGGLPNDPAKLAALSGYTFVSAISDKFALCDDGKLRNLRLEEFRERANKKSASATAAINKRWGVKPKRDTNEHTDVYTNEHTDVIRGQRSEVRGQSTEDRDQRKEITGGCKGEKVRKSFAYDADFEQAWKAWPSNRKGEKGAAFKAWKKCAGRPPLESILASIEAHKQHSAKWLDGFNPEMVNWINGRGFDNTFDANNKEWRP